MSKLKQNIIKERTVLDSTTSYKEIIQHALVNGLYGFNAGFVIAFVSLFVQNPTISNALLLTGIYFFHKQVESKILNRNKYTSKLGKNYIFPIPSTIGFVLGAYLSTLI